MSRITISLSAAVLTAVSLAILGLPVTDAHAGDPTAECPGGTTESSDGVLCFDLKHKVIRLTVTIGTTASATVTSTAKTTTTGGGGGGHVAVPAVPAPPRTCEQFFRLMQGGCLCLIGGEPVTLADSSCDYYDPGPDPTPPAGKAPAPKPTGPTTQDVLNTVAKATARLELPAGIPQVAPDPARNEWNMLVVNFPIWLTTTAPQHAATTLTQDGITITIDATRDHTVFHMDATDIQHADLRNDYNLTCTTMSVRKLVESPATNASPDCGFIYRKKGLYTITADTIWRIKWTALGLTGTQYVTFTDPAEKQLDIGELHAVIVAPEPTP